MAALACAASMFAVDFAAATKIGGKLFSYDETGKISAFQQKNDSHDYANPNFSFSVSGDKAGAAVKITTDGGTMETKMTTQTIWFKPIDALKFTVGGYDVALNKETIDWTESMTGLGGNGFLAQVNVAGFSLDLGLNEGAGDDFWLAKAKDADPVFANTFVKVGYSADFGSIGAYWEMNNKDPVNSWDAGYGHYALDTDATAVIKNMNFGAGYKNTFGPVTAFVNVVGHAEKTVEWVRPEVFVSANVSGLGVSLFAAPYIYTNANLNKKTECEVVAKVTYGIGGFTPYVYFKDVDVLASTFASTIKVGSTGNVGAMGWDVCVQLDTGKANNKVAVSVPFALTMSF